MKTTNIIIAVILVMTVIGLLIKADMTNDVALGMSVGISALITIIVLIINKFVKS